MKIETDRLVIREITNQDAAKLVELLNSEGFLQNVGDRGVRTEEQAVELIETRYGIGYPDYGLFAVELKKDNTWLGTVSYLKRDNLEYDDVGYAFLPKHFGKGYAIESTAAIVEWAKEKGARALYGVVDHHNTPSQRLLEKLQFKKAGTVVMEGETDPILKYMLVF